MLRIHSKLASKAVCASILCSAILLPLSLSAKQTKNRDEEAFLTRRIAEFWKDGDHQIVKSQINDFFKKFPESPSRDYFHGILGDVYLLEGDYKKALSAYDTIRDPSVQEKTLINKLQCYYELDQFEELARNGTPYLSSDSQFILDRKDEFYFLMAEALFRRSLEVPNIEEQKALAIGAKPLYEKVRETSYGELSEFALAEIHHILGNINEASELYIELAKKHPEKKGDFLYQAGCLLSSIDKQMSIDLFTQVMQNNDQKTDLASINRMILLFETEQYKRVIDDFNNMTFTPSENVAATLQYMVGKSHFVLENYEAAKGPLLTFLSSTNIDAEKQKNAYLLLLSLSHKTQNLELYAATLANLKSNFKDDSQIPKAEFIHAMLLKEDDQFEEASNILSNLFLDYDNFEDKEALLFESALIAYKREKWNSSYNYFANYNSQFKTSERSNAAWQHFLSSAIHLYQDSLEQNNDYSVRNFYDDIYAALQIRDLLTLKDTQHYKLLHARLGCELNLFNQSLIEMEEFISLENKEGIEKHSLAEAHYLAAYCLENLKQDPKALISHLVAAVDLNSEVYDNANTYLELYNAYLTLSGITVSNAPVATLLDDENIQKAAINLHKAVSFQTHNIKKENLLWLGNYYYQNVRQKNKLEDMDKARDLFARALYSENHSLSFSIDNISLEPEVLKYAELLGMQGEKELQIDILENMVEEQNSKTNLPWEFEANTLFMLAKGYEDLGDNHKALETYSFINSKEKHLTELGQIASFKTAKLEFALLDPSLRSEENEVVVSVLNRLKELQIRKNAFSEPLHLEAALEYANIRAAISAPDMKIAKTLFFLKRMKEDFTSEKDFSTQEYLKSFDSFPSAKVIHSHYISYLDAEINRLKAIDNNNMEEKETLLTTSHSTLQEMKNNEALPSELLARVSASLEEINLP